MRAAALAAAAVLAVAVASAGCGIFNTCGHPDEDELSCKALPASSTEPACAGRPNDDAGGPMTHLEDRYPVGCVIRFPSCLGAYPDSTRTCSCFSNGPGATPSWVCPI
jgi:hypothetical protein